MGFLLHPAFLFLALYINTWGKSDEPLVGFHLRSINTPELSIIATLFLSHGSLLTGLKCKMYFHQR